MKKYVDFPPKPKRGKSSYLFYCEAQRPIVAAANPEARYKDIMTMLGQDWSKLSDKQKIPYEKKGNAEKARYVKEMKGYTPPVETIVKDVASKSNTKKSSNSIISKNIKMHKNTINAFPKKKVRLKN